MRARCFGLIPVSLLACLALACSGARGEDRAEKPPVAVEAAEAKAAPMKDFIEVVGTLEPKFQAEVKAEVPGTVSEIYVSEWVRVRRGDPLARLDSREADAAVQSAKAALLQAQVAASRAVREYDRAVKLKEAGLMTQQGLEDALSAKEAASAQAVAAKAMLDANEVRLTKTVVRSPMDGAVALRAVSVGDTPGDKPIFKVVDSSVFDLTVTIPSGKIGMVKVGQPLAFSSDAVPGKIFEGKVSFINPSAEQESRAVKVVAQVPNPGGELKAGLFVKGTIQTADRPDVLQVPRSSLSNWDLGAGKAELFTLDGATAKKRAVETGATSGDAVEITGGLRAGDRVVTRGGFNLKDGDSVTFAVGKS